MNKEIEILIDGKPTKMKLPTDMQDSKIVIENGKVFAEIGVVDYINNLKEENQRLNNVLYELEKEINRLLERQYESEKFAKEQGFHTYLPAKVNLEYVKKRLNELKEIDK